MEKSCTDNDRFFPIFTFFNPELRKQICKTNKTFSRDNIHEAKLHDLYHVKLTFYLMCKRYTTKYIISWLNLKTITLSGKISFMIDSTNIFYIKLVQIFYLVEPLKKTESLCVIYDCWIYKKKLNQKIKFINYVNKWWSSVSKFFPLHFLLYTNMKESSYLYFEFNLTIFLCTNITIYFVLRNNKISDTINNKIIKYKSI